MSNEELIKALRCCADYSTGCYECPFDGKCIHESIAYNMDLKLAAANALEAAEKRIEELEAQLPKDGEWEIDEYGIYHCPICNAINNTVYKRFCPNCGTRMQEGE